MRILIFPLLVLSLIGSALAEGVNVIVKQYNFGEVIEGEVLNYVFALPLIDRTEKINSIVCSCDCLKPEVLKGKTSHIRLTWNTSGYSGLSEVYCLVFTNKHTLKFLLSALVFSP